MVWRPNHKIAVLLLHSCSFAVMTCNVDKHLICDPQVEKHSLEPQKSRHRKPRWPSDNTRYALSQGLLQEAKASQ